MMPIPQALALAVQHHQAGNLQQAEQLYRQILQVDPRHADALQYLGMLAYQVGKANLAIDYIGQAIALNPSAAMYHCNLAVVYQSLGRLDDAAASYETSLRLLPDAPATHYNYGLALFAQGKLTEAAARYREALRLHPRYVEAYNNLAAALSQDGKLDEAVTACREALRIDPSFASAHSNLAGILTRQGKLEEAEAAARAALRIRPNLIEAWNNLAAALTPLGKLDEAVAACRQALEHNPKSIESWSALGIALRDQGKLDESIEASEQLLRLRPDHPEAHVNRALAWFLAGDYARAWPEYEWRWKLKTVLYTPVSQPLWDGSPLTGRTILLRAEQGLGDTLHFLRYAPMVKERGGIVFFECPPALLPLLATFPGIDRLVPRGEPLPDFDVQAPLLSLPGIFGTTLDTIPAQVPYLSVDADLVKKWRERLATVEGFRIGIAWQGETKNPRDRQRSVPLTAFAPIARLPGVRLISLQKGEPAVADAAGAPVVFDDLDVEAPFLDTAAIMKNLDLVIAVDTVIGHLAGALGVPVWLAVSAAPHWPWLLEREDSPWYPTMRLFRQQRLGAWDDVFARLARAALPLAVSRTPGSIRIDVAAGELIDKITILEIKSRRIDDPSKLSNVRRELAVLEEARAGAVRESQQLDALTIRLRETNEALWQVEDNIRLCERNGDFGPVFVELARSIYRLNDRRADLKRQINELLGSHLVEEKSYRPYV